MKAFPSIRRRVAAVLLCASALAGACAAAPAPGGGAAAPAFGWSALADVGFQNLTTESGLPHSVVDGIAQDGAGFIWMRTEDGLARWDGYRFQVYRHVDNDPRSVPANVWSGPDVDARGRLWFGTGSGELATYDAAADAFVRLPGFALGSADTAVTKVFDDGPRRLLVGTLRGLYRVELGDTPGDRVRAVALEAGVPPVAVTSICRDAQGRTWVGTHEGLFFRGPGGTAFERFVLPGSDRAVDVFLPTPDALWISRLHELHVMDLRTLAVREVTSVRPILESLKSPATGIVQADARHVWVANSNGIASIDLASFAATRVQHDPLRPGSLLTDDVHTLFRDRSGLVWAAGAGGVSVHDPSHPAIASISGAGSVMAIQALPDGRVLLGDNRSGATTLHVAGEGGAAGRLARWPPVPASIAGNGHVLALARLPDGGAAVGTNNGVLLLDRAGRVVARHAQPRNIWAMDVQGRRLWLGSQKDGLWALDLDRPAAAPVRADLDLGEIDAVGPRLDGRLLVGTPNGLQWLDEDGSAHPVSIRNGGVDTPTGWVAAIAAGPRGRIWVSTNNGLYVLRREGAAGAFRSRHFGLREGLPSAVVDMVLFDAAGDAWVSTDGGIVAMSGKTFAMHVYDGKDGVAILEYWANSGAVAADGSLLFGAKRGLTVIRPEALRPWADLPPTVVTSMRIGDQPRRAGAFAADGSPALTIPPQANTFEVEFSSLDYSMPALNRYRYRLDGNDEHWIATDATHRVAAYSHLPPGDYVLHLQGSNRLGAWGRELALPVRVLPAWYQTWWFRATAAAGLLGAALMLHVLLTWRLRRNRAALERAVWLRTQEVVQQKDEVLRQKEEVLRQKELVDDKARQLDEKARQLEQANEMLERISVTDPLTGLHNRRYLTQNIDSDIAQSLRRHERGDTGGANADLVFFMIDLDHFKAVNDVYGHAAGDAVLKEVARRLQQVARKTDHLVRWGGEEFLLVARDTHRSLAPLIAERIRQVIREWPFELPEIELGKTCSVGYACYPFLQAHPRLLGWEEVAEIADQALYLAKHGGRDTWVGLQPTERLAATSVRQAVTATTDCLADGRLRRELPGDARPAVVAVAEPPDRRGRRREDVRG